jgi:hypothetical protein
VIRSGRSQNFLRLERKRQNSDRNVMLGPSELIDHA